MSMFGKSQRYLAVLQKVSDLEMRSTLQQAPVRPVLSEETRHRDNRYQHHQDAGSTYHRVTSTTSPIVHRAPIT